MKKEYINNEIKKLKDKIIHRQLYSVDILHKTQLIITKGEICKMVTFTNLE